MRQHVVSISTLLSATERGNNAPLEMAEIGVAAGTTSANLFRRFPNLTLWLVDPYQDYDGASADVMRELLRQALVNTQAYRDRRRFLIMESVDARELVPDGSLDLVFIDGTHTYDEVWQDITAWWPKLKLGCGSIMSGHDYSRKFRGLKQAVNEWAQENHHQLGFLPNRVWWTTKL